MRNSFPQCYFLVLVMKMIFIIVIILSKKRVFTFSSGMDFFTREIDRNLIRVKSDHHSYNRNLFF